MFYFTASHSGLQLGKGSLCHKNDAKKFLILCLLNILCTYYGARRRWMDSTQRVGVFQTVTVLGNSGSTLYQYRRDRSQCPPGETYITSLYGEYGFSDRLTGIVYFPFFVRALQYETGFSGTTGEVILPGDAVNSVGDTQLTVKYGFNFKTDNIALSASASLGLPFGNNNGGRDGSLQTGTGEWTQMLRLDASKIFLELGDLYPFCFHL